ncbi:MAG: hypothetical protein KKA84_01640 [Bacteroidetes bacterium]|nr:hypothetical protein [Bacteroidota bacterium]
MKLRTPLIFLIVAAVSITSIQLFFNSSSSNTPLSIELWYGKNQLFGVDGSPQRQINILGNITGNVSEFTYSLNDGEPIPLSIGPQKPFEVRRLFNPGDFATEIFSENQELKNTGYSPNGLLFMRPKPGKGIF